MWPLDFTDKNTLHMSLGFALLVAAGILLLASTQFIFDAANQLPHFVNEIQSGQINGNITSTEMQAFFQAVSLRMFAYKWSEIILLVWGLFLFSCGYIPFLRREDVKKKGVS